MAKLHQILCLLSTLATTAQGNILHLRCNLPQDSDKAAVAFMQILRSEGNLNKTEVLATAHSRQTSLAPRFKAASGVEASGSLTEGYMGLNISNMTVNHGVFLCNTGYYSEHGWYTDPVSRVLAVASNSTGRMSSYPGPGFEAEIISSTEESTHDKCFHAIVISVVVTVLIAAALGAVIWYRKSLKKKLQDLFDRGSYATREPQGGYAVEIDLQRRGRTEIPTPVGGHDPTFDPSIVGDIRSDEED